MTDMPQIHPNTNSYNLRSPYGLWSYRSLFILLACIVCGLMSLLSSCDKEETDNPSLPTGNGATNLHLTLGVSSRSSSTRGVSDAPYCDDNSWTDWERLIDGRYLYRVTVLLVDASNKLVGYKDWDTDIKSSTNTTSLSTTFYGIPSGATYTMYALANYSGIENVKHGGTTKTYNGLSNFPNISGLTVGSNVSTLITNLKAYKLDAGSDHFAPLIPQPLTLVKEITLPANSGNYAVNGELIRTYARLRIEMANRSTSYPINLDAFSLTKGFATNMQQEENLLSPTFSGKGSIASGLNSSDAITPYDNAKKSIAINQSTVIFDGYIYESQCTNGYGYNLTVSCDLPTSGTTYSVMGDAIELASKVSEGYYLIRINDTRYLKAGTSTVESTTNDVPNNLSTNKDCIWYFEKVANNQYYIRSAETKYYLDNLTEGKSVPLGNTKAAYSIFGGKIYIYNSGCYLYYDKNDKISGNKYVYTNLTFIPVTSTINGGTGNQTVSKSATVDIKAVTSGSTQSNVLKSINRNDFLNVLVNVLYNENLGTLNFEVEEWDGRDLGITFD